MVAVQSSQESLHPEAHTYGAGRPPKHFSALAGFLTLANSSPLNAWQALSYTRACDRLSDNAVITQRPTTRLSRLLPRGASCQRFSHHRDKVMSAARQADEALRDREKMGRKDYVVDFERPSLVELEDIFQTTLVRQQVSPVLFSTTAAGQRIAGLGGLPKLVQGPRMASKGLESDDFTPPVLFVGNHQLYGFQDVPFLIEEIYRRTGVHIRSLAHPAFFSEDVEGARVQRLKKMEERFRESALPESEAKRARLGFEKELSKAPAWTEEEFQEISTRGRDGPRSISIAGVVQCLVFGSVGATFGIGLGLAILALGLMIPEIYSVHAAMTIAISFFLGGVAVGLGVQEAFSEFLPWMEIVGSVPSGPRTIFKLLSRGETTLLYPGGTREAFKSTKKGETYKIFWPASSDGGDFARVAARFNATIVPVAAIGAEEGFEMVLDADELVELPFIGEKN